MKTITSTTNTKIKDIVSLRDRKNRDQRGLTLVEGLREIDSVLEAGWNIQEVFVSVGFDYSTLKNKLKSVDMYEVPNKVFAKIGYGQKQAGILAVCKQRKMTLDKLEISKSSLIIVADKVEKPGNLGAILRTADAAGIDAVFVTDGRTDVFNPNVIRASLGAVFSLAVVECSQTEAFEYFKKCNIQICIASPDADTDYTQCDFKKPTALVVGSEQDGLGETWINNADKRLKIPMYGRVDSLNVSASTAILLYEAIRQRN